MTRADDLAIPERSEPAASPPAAPDERPTSGRRQRSSGAATPLAGAALLHQQAATLPHAPGVYRMLDAKGEVLYVGKAKSLRKRVAGLRQAQRLSIRTCSAWWR